MDLIMWLGRATVQHDVLCFVLIDEVVDAVWSCAVVSSALHSNCLKGEGIKEQMHNWIYITHLDEIFLFWLLIKKCSCSAEVCVCVNAHTPVQLVHGRTLVRTPVDAVAGLQDALQTLRSITLSCTAHCLSFSSSWHRAPHNSTAFTAWHWPDAQRSNQLLVLLIFSVHV